MKGCSEKMAVACAVLSASGPGAATAEDSGLLQHVLIFEVYDGNEKHS
jgi:hypothetical protein